ncbi:MAG: DUF695 domain-containing protein [Clostridia bacterium]|nr:DUF695 domain-containing protein [Clostridia bacterium]
MSWFNKRKKSNDKDDATWDYFYAELQGMEASVRVDTKYKDAKYKHTYYVKLVYSSEPTTELPDKYFLQDVYEIEKSLNYIISNMTKGKIVYLGCATFGGSSYLIYASDEGYKWPEILTQVIEYEIEGGCYPNDNMGCYNTILYPKEVRDK